MGRCTTTRLVSGRTLHERSADARAEQAGYIERWIECDCGEDVYLEGLTNCCDCGADYSISGFKLLPRTEWQDFER